MRSKTYLAVLAVTVLVFPLQQASAQEGSACMTAITANMNNPAALARTGINPRTAKWISKIHDSLEQAQSRLTELQQTFDNLEVVELAVKKNVRARKALEKTRTNIMAEMNILAHNMNSSNDLLTSFATTRCRRGDEADNHHHWSRR